MFHSKCLTYLSLLLAIPSVLGVNLASLVQRQDQSSTTTASNVRSFFPQGVQDSDSSLESAIPIACDIGCWSVTGVYFYCFVSDTLLDGTTYDRSNCSRYICNQTMHDQYTQCLNCIIANGNERPYGYYTNSSKTAAATPVKGSIAEKAFNPNGLLNITQANQILSNITEFCNGVSSTLTGESTITASPTTTGPYFTSWTSGQDVQLTVWPGLQSYSSVPVYTVDTAAVGGATSSAGASGASRTSTGSGSAAPSSTSSSATSGGSKRLRLLWFSL